MRWLEFTQSVQFECEGRHKGPKFEKGERHRLADDFADRWLRRGVAQIVEGPVLKAPPKDEAPIPETAIVASPAAAEAQAQGTRTKPRNG